MTFKENLEGKIRGWFPQEPVLKTSRIQLFIKKSSQPKDFRRNTTNFLNGQIFFAFFSIYLFITTSIESLSSGLFAYFWICSIAGFIGLTIYNLRKYQGLQDIYSCGLFAASIGTEIACAVLYWFRILTTLSSIILVISSVVVFTVLYALVQRADKLSVRLPHRALAFSLALIGILALASSFAVVYHIEDTSEVPHSQQIFSEYFRLSQQLPDEVVNITLTTQDHISVDMTKAQNANLDPAASIHFTISDQPLNPNATVYFYSSTLDWLGLKSWDVPENGTYVFTLHFDYQSANYVWVEVTRSWSTIEDIPSEVATPMLAAFSPLVLVLAVVFLSASLLVPILSFRESTKPIIPTLKRTISQFKRSYL